MSFLVAALIGVLGAAAPSDWGPLHVTSHGPLYHNRLSYLPQTLAARPPHTWRLQADLSHANLWAQMPGYFYDGEWSRLSVEAGYMALPRLELTMNVSLVGRSGGILDGFIAGFHSALGLTQARRQNYPRDRLAVQTAPNGIFVPQLTQGDSGAGVANPLVGVRFWLTPAQRGAQEPKVVAEVSLQLPVGNTARRFAAPFGAGVVNLGLQQTIADVLTLQAVTGLILTPGDQVLLGMQLAAVQKFLFVSINWQLSHTLVAVAQYLNQDGIAEKAVFAPLNQTSHEFSIGLKWLHQATVWQLGLIENTVHDANAPDFGLFLGAAWRFDGASGTEAAPAAETPTAYR